jgi:hypothetical protein
MKSGVSLNNDGDDLMSEKAEKREFEIWRV